MKNVLSYNISTQDNFTHRYPQAGAVLHSASFAIQSITRNQNTTQRARSYQRCHVTSSLPSAHSGLTTSAARSSYCLFYRGGAPEEEGSAEPSGTGGGGQETPHQTGRIHRDPVHVSKETTRAR